MTNVTELIHLSNARQAIALAKTIDEAKEIRDRAEALRIYAKQSRLGLEIQNDCAEIKLRAERRAGEILAEMDKNPGTVLGGNTMKPPSDTPKLLDLGITKIQSHRWQLEASIPDSKFESFISGTRNRREELTSRGAYKLAKEISREEAKKRLAQLGKDRDLPQGIYITHGDFRELGESILPESIDLVFTDPSFGEEFLDLWSPLAKLAAKVLKPGKFLLTYCGKLYLPFVLSQLGEHLDYYWMAGKYYDQGHSFFRSKKIWDQWRPILIYQKPGVSDHDWFLDMIRMGSREQAKEFHDYGQSLEDAKYFIEKLSVPGDVVLDVCCGSGTIVMAAKSSYRRAIGFDVNESLTEIAKARLTEDEYETVKVS